MGEGGASELFNTSFIYKSPLEEVVSGGAGIGQDNLSQWGKVTVVMGLNKMAQHCRVVVEAPGAAGCNSHSFSENSNHSRRDLF